MMSEFAGRWRRAATEVAALLLLVQLPVAALYKLSSWLLVMRLPETGKEVALLVVIYALGAAISGFLIALIETMLARASGRAARHWHAIALLLLMLAVLLTMLAPMMAWWKGFIEHIPGLRRLPLPTTFLAMMLAILVAIIVRLRRVGWLAGMDGFATRLQGGARFLQILIAACALIVVATGYAKWQSFGWSDDAEPAQAKAGAPNVILISIDTLAAQDMSLYGYRLPTTPNIDDYARSAYVFEHYYAASNYTIPTIATMLTGRYPTTHRVTQLRGRLEPGDGVRTLPEVLRDHGYVTAAIVANDGAHPMYLRMSEAFDYQAAPLNMAPGHRAEPALGLIRSRAYHWLWDWWCGPYTYVVFPLLDFGSMQKRNWYPAEPVVDTAIAVAQSGRKPLFLWTHFMSPHEPYLPPSPFLGRFLPAGELDSYRSQVNAARGAMGVYRAADQPLVDKLRMRYDEYIAYTDDAVHQLLEKLRSAGALDNAIVVITADHGQSFERGWHGHVGPYLHDALIHIPLVIRLPQQAQGARVTANAEQVDLLPTVLDLAGIPTPDWAEGESLRGALERNEDSGRPKYAFDLQRESRFDPLRSGNYAVIEGRTKFIHRQGSGCEEFYDLAEDPRELHNRIGELNGERRVALRDLLSRKAGVPLITKAGEQDCKPLAFEFSQPAAAEGD